MANLREIEQDAAAERQELAKSLDNLTQAVAPENVKSHASALIEQYGSDFGRQAWDAAKSNPAAFALVGAGISLMLSGTGSRPERTAPPPTTVPPDQALMGFDERVDAAQAQIEQERTAQMDTTPKAAWLRTKLEDGLDTLPPEARMRVRQARQAAIDAQDKIERQAQIAAQKSRRFVNQQPLAVGALALGVGALVGALLPSTRREDEMMGEHRDAMMATARSTLKEELDKAHSAARAKLNGNRTKTADTPTNAAH